MDRRHDDGEDNVGNYGIGEGEEELVEPQPQHEQAIIIQDDRPQDDDDDDNRAEGGGGGGPRGIVSDVEETINNSHSNNEYDESDEQNDDDKSNCNDNNRQRQQHHDNHANDNQDNDQQEELNRNELGNYDDSDREDDASAEATGSNQIVRMPPNAPAAAQHRQRGGGMFAYPPPSWPIYGGPPPPPPLPPMMQHMMDQPQQQQQEHPPALLHYYEAKMRDHAAAYASAAAGAAWAAAQIAANVGGPLTSKVSSPSSGADNNNNGSYHQPIPVPMMLPSPAFPPLPHQMSYGAAPGQPFPPQLPPHPMYEGDGMQQQPPPAMFAGPQPPPQGFFHADPMQQQHPGPGVPYYYPPPHHGQPNHHGEDDYSYNSRNSRRSRMNNMEDSASEGTNYTHHRRKRQQRMSPSETQQHRPSPRVGHGAGMSFAVEHQEGKESSDKPASSLSFPSSAKRGRRRRRFRNDTSGSSGGEPDPIDSSRRRKSAMIKPNLASSSSDGANNGSIGSGTLYHHKKKQKQPSDESLLGKTGVAALYEWCGKRYTSPTFSQLLEGAGGDEAAGGTPTAAMIALSNTDQQDFVYTVTVDGIEWGRGRARTKTGAKQEAARSALRGLIPGVVFDEASGVLVRLPSSQHQQRIGQGVTQNMKQKSVTGSQGGTCSLEELAPNLAKRLAIGRTNEDEENVEKISGSNALAMGKSKNRYKPSKHFRRVYPGTSTTTSEEEDENAYYASRGASVCSALLHAIVQIDDRIPEAPIYSYEVPPVPSSSNSQLKRKGGPAAPASSYTQASDITMHRGPFTCTATMKLKHSAGTTTAEGEESGILQAVGVGECKKEARHIACAKLLALLFPECDGMVQVKQAAEAVRERYAKSKAMNLQSRRVQGTADAVSKQPFSPRNKSLSFAMATPADPPLPTQIAEHFRRLLGRDTTGTVSTGDLEHAENIDCGKNERYVARQLSRQRQLDEKVDATLQMLNEHDEEGRSLPDELTVDDVGRTVLRRAGPEDVAWITKLFGVSPQARSTSSDPVLSLVSALLMSSQDESSRSGKDIWRLWSSSTIILLLCRAIAPFEDPPLGCAVLTLGFSMQKGRVLRIAQIASEPHLPKERFIECLQSFASCMDYLLETLSGPDDNTGAGSPCIRADDQLAIVDSFLSCPVDDGDQKLPAKAGVDVADAAGRESSDDYDALVGKISSQLQSVLEESEEADESDICESLAEKRNAKKGRDKPSKRSRVN